MQELNNLRKSIEDNYSLDALKKLYRWQLKKLPHETDLKLDRTLVDFAKQKQQKIELTDLLIKVYTDKEIFPDILDSLPPKAQDLFYYLIWEGGTHKVDVLEKKFDLKILVQKNPKAKKKAIDNPFLFFCYEKSSNYLHEGAEYSFFMPEEIRSELKQFFETPEGFDLQPIDTDIKSAFLQENDGYILRYLSLLKNFIKDKDFKLAKNYHPTKSALRQIKKFCDLKEFYP